jgi:hypothetical protein
MWAVALVRALAVVVLAGSCGRETIDLARTTDDQLGPDGGASTCSASCGALGGVCSPTGECVQCNSDDDCTDDDVRHACDAASHKCVMCTQTSHCKEMEQALREQQEALPIGFPRFPIPATDCNTQLQRCGLFCSPSVECPLGLECNLDRGLCVECTSDFACEVSSSGILNLNLKRCLDGACVGCVNDGDCVNQHCEPSIQWCVDCIDSSDCDAGKQCRVDSHTCESAP